MGFKLAMFQMKFLLWKNYIVYFKYPKQIICSLVLPIIIIGMFLVVKRIKPAELRGPDEYTQFKLEGLGNHEILSKSDLYWSPCRNKQLTEMMNTILSSTNIKSKCFKTAKDLQLGAESTANTSIFGIDFGDNLIGKKCIGDKMSITIRLPSEINSGDWHTSELFDSKQGAGPRKWEEQHGYDPDYYETGFLNLQYAISMAIIKNLKPDNGSFKESTFFMRRYPYSTWTEDKALTIIKPYFALVIVYCILMFISNSAEKVAKEKEKRIMILLNTVGVSTKLQHIAWAVCVFSIVAFIVLLMFISLRFLCGSGSNFFERSDFILVLIFFMLYACTVGAFFFMMSTFFSREVVAGNATAILFFLSVLPCTFSSYDVSRFLKMFYMLLANSAMCEGTNLIFLLEEGKGWHWNGLCKSYIRGSKLTMCHVVFMLILDTILYIIIGVCFLVYAPKIVALRIFNREYWLRQNEVIDNNENGAKDKSELVEPDPADLQPGIQIINVTKTFQVHNAIDSLSLNVYAEQVTILLGHNGCGKSTLMNAIVGISPPTHGDIVVDESGANRNLKGNISYLGWCPENSVLFEELNVEQHILLFCRLKGLSKEQSKDELYKFLHLMKLKEKKKSLAKNLSGGMKRKLSIIIAICGNSKVCLLDEPSSGVDPGSRKDFWEALQSQKAGKAILMTTHYMDEAVALGDRIVIMSEGKLQAAGSTSFLKNKYGIGYRLVIVKGPNCNVDELTNVMVEYIPSIEILSDTGNTVIYVLPELHTADFESLFLHLETDGEQLGIETFSVVLTSIEDVFTKKGGSSKPNTTEANVTEHDNRQSSKTNFQETNLKGLPLRSNQIRATLKKKMICYSRSKTMFFLPFLIILIFMVLIACGIFIPKQDYDLEKLVLTDDLYDDFIVAVTSQNVNNEYYVAYKKIISEQNAEMMDWKNEDFGSNMVDYMSKHEEEKFQNLFGASFEENSITTWFNPDGYHVAPLALQYTVNTVLRVNLKCEDCHLEFVNHPLPFKPSTKSMKIASSNVALALPLCFALIYAITFFIHFYIVERVTNSKQLQFISGANTTVYWGGGFLWDYISCLICILIIVIFLICLQLDGISSTTEIGGLVLLLIIFGCAAIIQIYLLSFLFKSTAIAYTVITTFNIFCGPMAALLLSFFPDYFLLIIIHWILFITNPYFVLNQGITTLIKKYANVQICNELGTKLELANLPLTPCEISKEICCNMDDSFLSLNDSGIGRHLLILAAQAIVMAIILYLIENRIIKLLLQFVHQQTLKRSGAGAGREDIDVMEEKFKVKCLNDDTRKDYPVVVQDLTKWNGELLAVNQISFALQKSECFGLLGTNGSGKTTTLRMIVGELVISKGDIWIYGDTLAKSMRKIYKEIGYCPQFNALIGNMTGKETLIMFGLLRGLSYAKTLEFIDVIAETYGFTIHLNKRVKYYSNGNKRKLSTAIAMIGNPSIVLLDEPTAGVDIGSQQQIWNHFIELKLRGTCMLISSHNMEECEMITTRLTMMVNGKFECLESPEYLKNKYSQFIILTVMMKPSDLNWEEIDAAIKEQFPLVVFQDISADIIIYHIPTGTVPWSKIFGDMETLKKNDVIEGYGVTQSSLEQVFLYMTRLRKR